MNRCSLALLLSLVGTAPCLAQDATEELLTLPRAKRFVALGTAEDGGVTVCRDVPFDRLTRDPWGYCSRFAPGTSFSFIASTRDQIQVVWPKFNPLRRFTVVTTAKTPDASNLSLPGFSAASLRAIGLPDAEVAGVQKAVAKIAERSGSKAPELGPLGRLGVAIKEGPDVRDHLRAWSALTEGLAGVRRIRDELGKDIAALKANIKSVDELAKEAIAALQEDDRAKAPKPTATPSPTLGTGTPAGPPAEYVWNSRINEGVALALSVDLIPTKRDLLEALKALDATLKGYDDDARWSDDALVIDSIGTSVAEVVEKKVTLSEFDWTYEDGVLSRKTKESAPISLRARAARRLVPEASAAIVHTRLTKPVYSAVTKDAKTTVQQGKSEGVDVKAAALLNFVCRCFADTELYPMIQLGTTEIDAAPAVLFGGGIRLFGKTALAISAGGVAAWIRDLNNLKPGDEVSSDLAISADLKRRLQIKAYFAVQYRF